jgi:hypothetical protein
MNKPNFHPTQHLELFPASLLSKRQTWQPLTAQVPAHAIVLISRLNDRQQTGFMQGLGCSLQKQGMKVFVLSVGLMELSQ